MAWSKEHSSFGTSHWVFQQEETMSCGMACALMIFQRLRGVKLEEADARKAFRMYAQGVTQGAKSHDQNIMSPHDFHCRGVEVDELKSFLSKVLGIPFKAVMDPSACAAAVLDNLGSLKQKNRTFAVGNFLVRDNESGRELSSHFIVLDGTYPSAQTTCVVLADPSDGKLHEVAISRDGELVYRPKDKPKHAVLKALLYYP
jgi:hypothetical protein